ncbi:T9SS type A sorting domain-containing protein [Fodinibius sediminis]|uniref:Por secretion system C-terminal sorting domain-containing protein n=1 Tax=Fodinibius sediminis TaxID=1214077 RepID=A0A521F4M2_9BACT|nr:T9SS type A sorting domain-containing protein [Fodinibius sediminis]SMO91138.1 Por secretion system C-terminal sorting domain-containing protein [Fodinibius sediminis]
MSSNGTKRFLKILGMLLLVAGGILLWSYFSSSTEHPASLADRIDQQMGKMDRAEKKAARSEYFFRLMRDPATNSIPINIRNRELKFARTLPAIEKVRRKRKAKNPSFQAVDYSWSHAGPFDLGGRTRALAVDRRDPSIVLAGGVSGGMWRSTDGGASWQLRTPDLSNLSVTSVAQDPQNQDTWYYASGEILGNTAGAPGAAYYGEGIYKSTDNGRTWSLLPQARSEAKGLVAPYNTVSRIVVSPSSGTVFIASNGFGIYRSTDGETFSGPTLGTAGEQLFCDVAVAADGTVAAVISEASFDDQQSSNATSSNHNPGVFISTDDGQNWTEITPDTYPSTHRRSVLSFAPSNSDVLYILTLKGVNNTSNQGVSFHKIDLGSGSAEDRSENLPDFRDSEGEGSGYMGMQGGYNMEVAVKPDDENFVILGAINLFRSTDGFATAPSGGYDPDSENQKDQYWIGGYNKNNGYSSYPNQHPDQHRVIFPEPSDNPERLWAGHDGGLSYTSDVTATSVSWEDRDDDYVTSQFYTAAIAPSADDTRLMGGTQDNGTPFFQSGGEVVQETQDISSGDGGYSYFTDNYLYVSQQEGSVIRWEDDFSALSYVYPSSAENQLFIHPYQVDPNNENTMYYAGGNHLWRNTQLNNIPNDNSSSGASEGWEELNNISVGSGYVVSALEVSTVPANILYLGGYASDGAPVIKRLQNAHTATDGAEDVSLPGNSGLNGAYIKDIAVNPANANEVLAVLSNYNITGLYHSTNGGESWTAVEGNLTGNDTNPGPSLRSAAIIPAKGGTVYLLGTSIGLYSTQVLDGSNTEWGQEAQDVIGNVVTSDLASRITDGNVAAGTHGRGMTTGDFGGTIDITELPRIELQDAEQRVGSTLIIRAVNFEFSTVLSENKVTLIDRLNNQSKETPATVLEASATELTIEVPRDAILPEAPDNDVLLKVRVDGTEPSAVTFTVLPPNSFALKQNYPNPFRSTTNIPFDVSEDSEVSLTIYSINGQKVTEPLRNQSFNAGSYDEEIDLSGLASGVYIYRLVAKSGLGTKMTSKKMTLIK